MYDTHDIKVYNNFRGIFTDVICEMFANRDFGWIIQSSIFDGIRTAFSQSYFETEDYIFSTPDLNVKRDKLIDSLKEFMEGLNNNMVDSRDPGHIEVPKIEEGFHDNEWRDKKEKLNELANEVSKDWDAMVSIFDKIN